MSVDMSLARQTKPSKLRRSQKILRAILLLAVCVATALSQSTNRTSDLAKRVMGTHRELTGVPHFGEVTPTLYRGGQPTREGFGKLAAMGIKIVVDTGRSKQDEELMGHLGLRYVVLPWYCPFPKDKVFAEFLKVVKENPDKKIFVHCRLGEDRTGMMIASYRMALQGWSADEALDEMHEFGYRGVHHLMCPGLAEYEKHFPQRLKTDPLFEELTKR